MRSVICRIVLATNTEDVWDSGGGTSSDWSSPVVVVSPAPVRSMSTVDLSEKACAGIALPPPDYSECLARGADASKPPSTFKAPASKPETVSPVSRATAWRPGCPRGGLWRGGVIPSS